MTAFVWISSTIAIIAAVLTIANLPFWPRGRVTTSTAGRRVSVLIPARNEERNIEQCVRAAMSGNIVPDEIIVCNDGSTDATGAILDRLSAEFSQLRVVGGIELPQGWIGKVHANHQLGRAATGDLLVFIDADVRLLPTGIGRIIDVIDRYRCDVLTANPRQLSGTWLERLVMPMMYVTYLSWLFIPLMWHTRDPRVCAGNGQVFAYRRDSYDRLGGYEAIRSELVDDMAMARRTKQLGMRVVLMDGHHAATCRMYNDSPSLWRGFTKNIYEGLGGGPVVLLAAASVHLMAWVVPPIALLAGLAGATTLITPAAIGVLAALVQRAVISARFDQRWLDGLAYPAGALAIVAIALNSWRCTAAGRLEWAGRVYAARANRHP